MAYTPELSQRGSATLRRPAWFRGKPMSKRVQTLLEATGRTMAEIRPGGREANRSFYKKELAKCYGDGLIKQS